MTTAEIAEIAKSGTKAELAAQIAELREALAAVQDTLAAATGTGEEGVYTAVVESVAADGSSTRITLVVPRTYGEMWADLRAGNTVSLIDTPDLPADIADACNIDL